MALNPSVEFAGKITPPSAEYPYGEARNVTVTGDGTGTPLLSSLVNDIFGFQQSLLSFASVVPSNVPEEVNGSQYLQSLNRIGVMKWNTNTTYPVGVQAQGSDLFYYVSIVEQSGNDPVSDGGVNWVLLKSIQSTFVDNVTELRAVKNTVFRYAFLNGHTTISDGGAGLFFADLTDVVSTDNNGTIIVATDGTRWKRIFDGDVLRSQWFGVFADAFAGNTPQQVNMQLAIDAVPVGGTLITDPGLYWFTAPLNITKYMTFRGVSTSGFQFSTVLVFDNSDGIHLDKDYVTIEDIQLWGPTNPTVIVTDPVAGTWGNIGLRIGTTTPSPNLIMNNVIVAYFNTGMLSDSATNHDPYYKFNQCRWFFNNINIALVGTWAATFIGCDVRAAHQHGIYAEDTLTCSFIGGVLELCGSANVDLNTDPDATNYGIFVKQKISGGPELKLSDIHFELFNVFCDEDARIMLHNCTYAGGAAAFGKGDFIFTGGTTPNLLPRRMLTDWSFTGRPTVTDGSTLNYTRVQVDTGTSVQAFVNDIELKGQLIPQDILQVLFSIDVKIVNGHQDGSFDVDWVFRIDQDSGKSDNTAQGANWRSDDYNWADNDWHTIFMLHTLRYGGGNLDIAELTLKFIQSSLSFSSSDFSVNALDAQVKSPRLQFLSNKEIQGSHPLDAGGNGHHKLIQKSIFRLSGLSGASVNWVSAIPSGSIVYGLGAKILKTVTGATSIDIGVVADTDILVDGMGVALDTTATVSDSNVAFVSPILYRNTIDIVVTAVGGNFTAGDIVLELYFSRIIAPVF